MKKENILVSACLFGKNCKYNGKNNKINDDIIDKIKRKFNVILVCPEELGGLTTPREPSEILKGEVYTKSGKCVTSNFRLGALKILKKAKENNIKLALLKANSPSCGNKYIYNGKFEGTLIEGKGISADLLLKNKIEVINEKEIDNIL
ncbi:DUF523 domain-containing protein [Anaerofustis sp.]|uniref:DUF523 domain-containing protein n=1 Tax=Anaerofustis sp. TaxID=1872517 RepID=UPI0025C28D06|nr:DUF523 domain-containing protein [Anaerofustis sp.]